MKPEILLVEDNDLLQNVIPQLLKNYGCQVSVAQNGHQALEMCSFKYDLILLDIHLPDMNGVDVCKKIRSIESKLDQRTTIIAYTAIENTMDQECINAGFDGVVVKDNPEKLLDILKIWLPSG